MRAEYEIGASVVSDDAARYGDGTGYDEQGVYPLISGDGGYKSKSLQYLWRINNLGVDSRDVELGIGKQGTYSVNLRYHGVPNRLFDSTQTVFTVGSDNSLVLPDGWTRSGSTLGFAQLPAHLLRRNIESDRDVFALRARYRVSSRFQFHAEYRRHEQQGVRITGGSFFSNSTQLPQPFDYANNEVDVGISYKGSRARARIGVYASTFQNTANSLVWENPFDSIPGAERGSVTLAPDNNFAQASLKGAWSVGNSTAMSLAVATGRARQDDELLNYTINPILNVNLLPRPQLDGEIDTTNLSFSLSSRPASNIAVSLKYRFDERNNRTPKEVWSRVILDSFNSTDTLMNIPFNFERSRLAASGVADLSSDVQVSGGFERVESDRDFQEVAEQTEDIGWGKLRWTPNPAITVDTRAGTAKREIDSYDADIAIGFGQNPLLRKYNLAHRFREFGEVRLTTGIPEKPISVAVGLIFSVDDYSKSVFGLLSSKEKSYSADLSWSISEHALMSISAGFEKIDAKQAGGSGSLAPDWFADYKDEFKSYSIGMTFKEVGRNVDVKADYSRGVGTSKISVDTGAVTTERFPNLESNLDTFRLSASYKGNERTEWIGEMRYERLQSSDWSLQDVDPDTIPLMLSLGAAPIDYDIFQFGVSFKHYFGRDGA